MTFVSGLDLAERFYREAVRPLLDMRHAAELIGPGSEVLGFDTEMSTDHDWGPRLLLFVEDPAQVPDLRLPTRFQGWSTRFTAPDRLRHHADAIAAAIASPALRALPRIGAIDQCSDNADLLRQYRRTKALYLA